MGFNGKEGFILFRSQLDGSKRFFTEAKKLPHCVTKRSERVVILCPKMSLRFHLDDLLSRVAGVVNRPVPLHYSSLRSVRRPETRPGDVGQDVEISCLHLRDAIHGLCTIASPQETLARVVKDRTFFHIVRPIRGLHRATGRSVGFDRVLVIAESIIRRSFRIRLACERLRARRNPGTAIAASNAMIATTIMISTRVKPFRFDSAIFISRN